METTRLTQVREDSELLDQLLSSLVIYSPLLAIAIVYAIRFLGTGSLANQSTGEVINLSLPVFLLLSVLIEGMGYSSTIFRGYLNKEIFKRHKTAFLLAPAVIFVLCVFSPAMGTIILFFNSLYFMFHASMQNYGIFRFYEREAGIGRKAFSYYAFFMAINLLVHFTGSTLLKGRLGSSSHFYALEQIVPGAVFSFLAVYKGIGVFLGPVLPFVFYASVAFVFFVAWLAGRNTISVKGGIFTSLYFLYWAWALWFSNPLEAMFGHNIVHCAQTFGMAYRSERGNLRDRSRSLPIALPSGIWLFFLALLILVPGGILNTAFERISTDFETQEMYYYPLLLVFAFYQALRFTHFYTDGLIWRKRNG